jgi:hypothetical protein
MQANRLICRDEQGRASVIATPSPETVRSALLEVIQRKPLAQPVQPVQPDLFDEAAWRRRSRGAQVQKALRAIPRTTKLATVLGVTSRCIRYWRTGHHAPTPRHYCQLMALRHLLILYSDRS